MAEMRTSTSINNAKYSQFCLDYLVLTIELLNEQLVRSPSMLQVNSLRNEKMPQPKELNTKRHKYIGL